jgi:exopolysaccharide biosynthesis polyprenyl glycosylphosphotransferase
VRGARLSTHTVVNLPHQSGESFPREPGESGRPSSTRGDTLNFTRIVTPGESRWTWEAKYIRSLILTDLIMGMLASVIVFMVRFGTVKLPQDTKVLVISFLVPFVWLGVLAGARTYETRFLFEGTEEYQRVFRSGVALAAGVGLLSYAFDARLPRSYPLMVLPALVVLSTFGRYARRRRLHRSRREGYSVRRVLLLGHPGPVANLIERLRKEYFYGLNVVGICLPTTQLPSGDGHHGDPAVLGDFTHASAAARAISADTVIVLSCPELDGAGLRRLAWSLERDDIDLIVASSLIDVAGDRITIRPVDGLPMLHIEHPSLSGVRRIVKVIFDVVVAATLSLIVTPVLLLLALLIRIDSPGPALFRQIRVGKDGRDFSIFKFRTMHRDAEARRAELAALANSDSVLFKMQNDPRVTRVGRILRRLSLDELPQLLNVLRGEMSLVGPRPPLPSEVEAYPDDMRRRLVVKPGMTGLWQISGRSDLLWEDAVRLDLQYVENWSLTLDMVIMMRTLTAVVRSSGAY